MDSGKLVLRHVLPVTASDAPDGSRAVQVHCPRQGKAVAVRECGRCEHCLGMTLGIPGIGSVLKCAWREGSWEAVAARDAARLKLTPGPTVGELVSRLACGIPPEASVEAVTERLLAEGLGAVAVLDERGKAIGVVSKTDLLRKYFEDGDTCELRPLSADAPKPGFHENRAGKTCVGEIMNRIVFGLSADASLGRAAALMAYEGVQQLVVFDDAGRVLGALSSQDVLRWLAKVHGFAMPERREGSSDTPP